MRPPRLISFGLIAALASAVLAPIAAANAADVATSSVTATSTSTIAAAAPSSCTITADDVTAIQTAAAQGLLAELTARRALLSRTITCAINDAQGLQGELANTSLGGLSADVANGAGTIQSQLSGKLGDAITYYNLELSKVDGAGIVGTQAIAKETLDWRSANYAPLASNVENFELWISSQPLITAASDRLNGIASLVAFFEQAGQNNELQADLASAQSLMQTVRDENAASGNALLQSLPPDQTHAQIGQTLQTLSSLYQQFFTISDAIKALLPASK